VLSLFFAEGTDCSQSSADGAGVVKIVTVKTVNVVSDFGFSQFENAVLVNFFLFDDREIVNADVLHGMTISRIEIILINLGIELFIQTNAIFDIFYISKANKLLPWTLAPACPSAITLKSIASSSAKYKQKNSWYLFSKTLMMPPLNIAPRQIGF